MRFSLLFCLVFLLSSCLSSEEKRQEKYDATERKVEKIISQNNKEYKEFLKKTEENDLFYIVEIDDNIKCLKKYPNVQRYDVYDYTSYWICRSNAILDRLQTAEKYDLDVSGSEKNTLISLARSFESTGYALRSELDEYKNKKSKKAKRQAKLKSDESKKKREEFKKSTQENSSKKSNNKAKVSKKEQKPKVKPVQNKGKTTIEYKNIKKEEISKNANQFKKNSTKIENKGSSNEQKEVAKKVKEQEEKTFEQKAREAEKRLKEREELERKQKLEEEKRKKEEEKRRLEEQKEQQQVEKTLTQIEPPVSEAIDREKCKEMFKDDRGLYIKCLQSLRKYKSCLSANTRKISMENAKYLDDFAGFCKEMDSKYESYSMEGDESFAQCKKIFDAKKQREENAGRIQCNEEIMVIVNNIQ